MDYHEQPLQFINYNYFKVKDANDGVYQNISTLIFSIAQFPLFGMPFISYMTINYIYPKIHYYLKQYTVHMHVSPLTIMGVTAIMLFFCLSIVIYFIGIVLVISHVGSIVEFIDYCNKVLAEEDSNLPYILAGFSSFAIVALFVIATGVFLYKLKQIRRFTPEYFSFLIAASFSVNIIYILCYFSPFMFLAFLHNPLVTFSTYFMVIISIVSFCLITSLPTFYVTNFGIVARQQARVVNRRMAYFISTTTMLVIVTSGYALVLLMMFLGVALLIGNFSNSQSLQTILLSLLLGLISFWILKPIYKKAQREGLIDNENTEEVPEE